jgi:heptosyltransferase-3
MMPFATQTHYHHGTADYPPLDFGSAQIRAAAGANQFPPAPNVIQSILVIKLDAMGDYLLHTPFFAHLRSFYSHANIVLLCHAMNKDLSAHNPAFNDIIICPHEPGHDPRQALMLGMQLQSHHFDLIIHPRWGEDWHHANVIAQAIDAPYRLSYAANCTPFKAKNFLQHDDCFTHVIDDPRPTHEVWRGMQLLHALGMPIPPLESIRLALHTTQADRDKVNAFLADKNYPRPWFAFGIGASAEFKRWPAVRFAELAKYIAAAYGGSVFLIGQGTKDQDAAGIITKGNENIVNCMGHFHARETGILIGECDIIVSNDSFTMHAAAAMNTPVVEVIGHPADGNPASEYLPHRFGPWGVNFAWIQPATCNGAVFANEDYLTEPKCIGDIPAAAAFNAIQEALHHGTHTS